MEVIIIISIPCCFHGMPCIGVDDQASLDGPIEEVARVKAQEAEILLKDLGIPVSEFYFSICIVWNIMSMLVV